MSTCYAKHRACRASAEQLSDVTRYWAVRGLVSVFIFPILLRPALLFAADLPRTPVQVVRPSTGEVLLTVDAELAITIETRRRGLMERALVPADQGMLFIFEVAQPLSFWMFNTLIPLDILFIDAQRRIAAIHAAVPPCQPPRRCPTYASDGPAQFVLEVNAGVTAKAGIRLGDEVRWTFP
jgi:uncharacterized membrane protein (UPF0127 family)